MTTVYVVTQGEYSDYGIDEIFSTKALAERYVNGDSQKRIEEYELDKELEKISRPFWSCTVHLFACKNKDDWPVWDRKTFQAGELVPSHSSPYSFKLATPTQRTEPAHFCYGPAVKGERQRFLNHPEYGRIVTTSYVSQEHANKLAVEAYQAWLRAGKPTHKDWLPDDPETAD